MNQKTSYYFRERIITLTKFNEGACDLFNKHITYPLSHKITKKKNDR